MVCVVEIVLSLVFVMESCVLRCIYIKSDNNKKKINVLLIFELN